ncbi:hypothetical protein D3P07_00850 [Paenibacillus sp. 1011MAR3C5]|uniref:hypothetical protein n=1 Tax=Paenibacillus sp. 1011MAR3C5 TaxID=1675787 RepID=UPI000E6B9717|nr:hypothetical protein [Paenibacillus sp. 1011MAR3C5]RJE90689.1 hypothetical protein D3P07_00850 [Paenibacillus sp. 1011MAR3C5]
MSKMLDDTARKLHRIFFNLYQSAAARVNDNRLARLSGRTSGQISAAIRELADDRYITWDERAGIVKVIAPEERRGVEARRPYTWADRSRTG